MALPSSEKQMSRQNFWPNPIQSNPWMNLIHVQLWHIATYWIFTTQKLVCKQMFICYDLTTVSWLYVWHSTYFFMYYSCILFLFYCFLLFICVRLTRDFINATYLQIQRHIINAYGRILLYRIDIHTALQCVQKLLAQAQLSTFSARLSFCSYRISCHWMTQCLLRYYSMHVRVVF